MFFFFDRVQEVIVEAFFSCQLLRRRSVNIFSYKTNQIVHRAIRMTIETGAVLIATWAKGGNSAVSGVEYLLFVTCSYPSLSLIVYLGAFQSANYIQTHY